MFDEWGRPPSLADVPLSYGSRAKMFEVGGCVRDEFLGLQSKDIDFTFVLDNLDQTVEQGFADMTAFLKDNGFEIFLSTPDCFTIRAKFPKDHVHAGLVADFVMARKEIGVVPGTRRPILKLGTLHDDLERRDFRCNAIAKDVDGKIIDPFEGVADIQSRLLDTPLDPTVTFMDDPLRMLRAIRFRITKGFAIAPRVLDAMKQPELIDRLKETVSDERIREELGKAFAHDTLKTLRILNTVDELLPGFLDACFDSGLRLEPTFKKTKKNNI
jgi:tRNA nucleotidyltransferase/poly(A) polymerase